MATSTLLTIPVKNQGNGRVKTSLGVLPANLQMVYLTIQCTTGNPAAPFTGFQRPFNNPAMQIVIGIDWSWDSGTTYPQSMYGSQNGSATGTWGTDRQGNPIMVPNLGLGMPTDDSGSFPNAFRLTETIVNGPITYGVTITAATS